MPDCLDLTEIEWISFTQKLRGQVGRARRASTAFSEGADVDWADLGMGMNLPLGSSSMPQIFDLFGFP